jgi:hypothetical protein
MSNRTQVTITANDATYNIGKTVAEHTTVSHEVQVVTDHRGVMMARPEHYATMVRNIMNRRKGELLLLQVAIASQRFNLLARDQAKHPKAQIIEQVKRGNQWVDLHRTDLVDFQPGEYSLAWEGDGNDGLHGCTVHEELALVSSSGKESDMGRNDQAPFNFGG